jgi:hypothetical protein
MLNETIGDLELQDKEEKKVIRNKVGR